MSTPSSDVRIHTRETVRTARYAALGAEPSRAQRLWFVLHGYGQLAPRFLRHFEGAVPPDTCIIAPEGLSRFYVEMPRTDGAHLQRVGATWMTREAREDDIADTMRWLELISTEILAVTGNVPVGVLAFSQGVATATRWLAHSGLQPDAFVAWAGGVAHDIDDQRMRDVLHNSTVTLVAGTDDGFVTPETRATMLATLQQWQPAAHSVAFAGGHHLDRTVLADLLAELTARPFRATD